MAWPQVASGKDYLQIWWATANISILNNKSQATDRCEPGVALLAFKNCLLQNIIETDLLGTQSG
jgi:hypothetical protein